MEIRSQTASPQAIWSLTFISFLLISVAVATPRLIFTDLIDADLGFGLGDFVPKVPLASMQSDFPGGTAAYNISVPMQAASWLWHTFSIDPVFVQKVYVALEPVLVFVSGFLLVRHLVPHQSKLLYSTFAIFFCVSTMRFSNLGTWPSPFYSGLFYAFAESSGIGALLLLLNKRLPGAAVFLAISMMCHAAVGICFVAFCAGSLLAEPRELMTKKAVLSAAVFGLLMTPWLLNSLKFANGVEVMTEGDWIAALYWGSYHTFPIDAQLFGLRHTTYFTAFCAFVTLFGCYFAKYNNFLPHRAQIIGGCVASSIIVSIGLIASYTKTEPAILKLHLHRASMMVLLVGSPYVVFGLWKDIQLGNMLERSLAGVTFIQPFYLEYGFAIGPAVAIAGLYLLRLVRSGVFDLRAIILSCILGFVAIIYTSYYLEGYLRGISEPQYFGFAGNALWILAAIGIAISAAFARRTRALSIQIILLIIALTLGIFRQVSTFPWQGEQREYATDLLAVQRWAHDNTKPGTIFMDEPTHAYGWRTIAQRPSFGTLREWLLTSFLYGSDEANFREGLRRFSEFKLKYADYLDMAEPLDGYYKARIDITEAYCNMKRDWFEKLQHAYSVSYFLRDRNKCAQPLPLQIVFENNNFQVGHLLN